PEVRLPLQVAQHQGHDRFSHAEDFLICPVAAEFLGRGGIADLIEPGLFQSPEAILDRLLGRDAWRLLRGNRGHGAVSCKPWAIFGSAGRSVRLYSPWRALTRRPPEVHSPGT